MCLFGLQKNAMGGWWWRARKLVCCACSACQQLCSTRPAMAPVGSASLQSTPVLTSFLLPAQLLEQLLQRAWSQPSDCCGRHLPQPRSRRRQEGHAAQHRRDGVGDALIGLHDLGAAVLSPSPLSRRRHQGARREIRKAPVPYLPRPLPSRHYYAPPPHTHTTATPAARRPPLAAPRARRPAASLSPASFPTGSSRPLTTRAVNTTRGWMRWRWRG